MTRGRFITFEGGEGSGKSTQARLLADRLRGAGRDVVVTREPGGTPFGERIRELIFSDFPTAHLTECLLFAASRAEHMAGKIMPALAVGSWVVCDRFIDSTRVYQGDVWNVDRELIASLERHTVDPWWPDLTIMLDIEPELGLSRAVARGETNRYEREALAVHEVLRGGFLRIARAEPERCVVIDGGQSAEAVAAAVWAAVEARLLAKAA